MAPYPEGTKRRSNLKIRKKSGKDIRKTQKTGRKNTWNFGRGAVLTSLIWVLIMRDSEINSSVKEV